MALPLATLVHPSQAALIVVDIQNDFCDENGVVERSGVDRSLIRAMVPNLVQFVKSCEAVNLPIVYVRTTYNDWSNSPAWAARDTGYIEPMAQRDTWGWDFYKLHPRPQDAIVEKHRYSGFINTNLDLYLRSRGIKSLLMTGVATNVCVETTARDGFCLDYHIVMVEDCCASRVIEDHLSGLSVIRRFFGTVASVAQIEQAWQESGVVAAAAVGS